jgi:hypothetical protein
MASGCLSIRGMQSNSQDERKSEIPNTQSAWSRNMINILRAKLNNFHDTEGKRKEKEIYLLKRVNLTKFRGEIIFVEAFDSY